MQEEVKKVFVSDSIIEYIEKILNESREKNGSWVDTASNICGLSC